MCQFIKLVKGFMSAQDDVSYVNIGYQCIYQGILKSNLKFCGNQSLQLLIKSSKWNLAITEQYRATIANAYSVHAFCLTVL